MKTNKMVIGVGLPRTGTTTLGKCFEILGYQHVGFETDLVKEVSQNNFSNAFAMAKGYTGFEDLPWSLMYKEFDKRFPECKFILTVRKEEIWLNSIKKHSKRFGPTRNRELVFGYAMPDGHEDKYIKKYREHNQSVIDYFKGRKNKLLIVSWEKGDKWSKICSFLDKKVPNQAFPFANKSPLIDLEYLINPLIRKIINNKIGGRIFRNDFFRKIHKKLIEVKRYNPTHPK